jgi:adenine deaminase
VIYLPSNYYYRIVEDSKCQELKEALLPEQNIKKLFHKPKVLGVEERMSLELLSKQLLKLVNMLTEIDEEEKEILDLSGSQELTLLLEN